MIHNKALSNNVETTANANLEEETIMTNKMVANVEENIIGGINMKEEVEMKKVSILDRFAAHHNRAEDAEVVVEEKKEEEVEMNSSIEEEVAKIVDELERQAKVKADNEEFDRMVEREEKKAMFKAKVSGLFGIAKSSASVAKDKVANTVNGKVEDFLFGSLDEESSAPVEKEVKEVKVAADEVLQSIKPAFEGAKAFFTKKEVKKEDYAEQTEEVEEKISANGNRMVEVDEEFEGLIDGLRAELEKEAELKAELKEINKMREEIRLEMELATDLREQKEGKKELSVEDKLEQEIEGLKAQIAFEQSKQEALLVGVKESDVLNTKEDIDAYFMGQ